MHLYLLVKIPFFKKNRPIKQIHLIVTTETLKIGNIRQGRPYFTGIASVDFEHVNVYADFHATLSLKLCAMIYRGVFRTLSNI